MKAELTFPQELIDLIADRVIDRLKPLLSSNGKPEDGIFDVEGLAEYLKVDESWIYKKVQYKELPHFKAGKYLRFKKSSIDKWIESQTIQPIP